jgi:branched-chain amino acid transport system substrate-binding protein
MMGLAMSLLTVRAVEQVVKVKGPAGVTGADIRTALQTNPIPSERTFGVLPNIKFSNEAPFPTSGLAVNIGTIEKGKYKLVEQNAPVPNVNKW